MNQYSSHPTSTEDKKPAEVLKTASTNKEAFADHTEQSTPLGDACLPRIRTLLSFISPKSYSNYLGVGEAIFRETNGSDAGLGVFKEWAVAGKTFWTPTAVEFRWKGFPMSRGTPVYAAYIERLAREGGFDAVCVSDAARSVELVADNECNGDSTYNRDEASDSIITIGNPVDIGYTSTGNNPFEKASLRDHHRKLKQEVQEQRGILGSLAMLGQSTVFYADPNTGKTLVCLSTLINSVQAGEINPDDVFYLNADDSGAGLAEKVSILKEYGVHMLGDGYHGFQVELFQPWSEQMIADGSVKGKIFFLDTLTRFFDTNNKTQSRRFTKHVRKLTSQGATVIALAHTRKNPGQDGGKVYAGTSDVYNDFDCAYMVVELSAGGHDGIKTIEFRNKKRRGDVKMSAAFSYPNKPMKSYEELLLSVELADPDVVSTLTKVAEIKTDMEVISAIRFCIRDGIKTRMLIANTVGPKLQYSRAKTLGVLDDYTGNTPGTHFWSYVVGDRGAHIYALLPEEQESAPGFQLSSSPARARG